MTPSCAKGSYDSICRPELAFGIVSGFKDLPLEKV